MTLTKVAALAVGFHRVAVVLGEKTPGGAALVHWAPAAPSAHTTRLGGGGQRSVMSKAEFTATQLTTQQ